MPYSIKQTKLKAKREVIRNLNRSRLVIPVLFEDLLPIIPSDVWFKGITASNKGQGIHLKFQSNALSNFSLATWLTNLEQSKHFSQVKFDAISYSKKSAGAPPQLRFSLDCQYKHVGPFPLEEYY